MKFAKELDEDLVPEWRAKYFDYKTGKKKVKAIARALRNVNTTPQTPGKRKQGTTFSQTDGAGVYTPKSFAKNYQFVKSREQLGSAGEPLHNAEPMGQTPETGLGKQRSRSMHTASASPMPIPEREPLHQVEQNEDGGLPRSYGSILATPPKELSQLELPDPALNPEQPSHVGSRRNGSTSEGQGDAYHVGTTNTPQKPVSSIPKRFLQPKRSASTPGPGPSPRPDFFRRMFSTAGVQSPLTGGDVSLRSYRELDTKQDEFFDFLDGELNKIEDFYKVKESEASERLQHLREQLHEMRDRRVEELYEHKNKPEEPKPAPRNGILYGSHIPHAIESAVGRRPHFGKNTTAMANMGSPSQPQANEIDHRRDYTRKPRPNEVPYRAAKKKLKMAMQEFYRGLELLKSYALLNRTAFRKITKKYDKTVNARPTGRYMSENVNKAYFVKSEAIDQYITTVEDLYARYFEKGSRKIAVGKLRVKTPKSNAYTATAFRNGLLLAGGLVLGIEGLVHGAEHLFHHDPDVVTKTEYLLQIYAGYFLSLLLFLLFVLDCRLFSRAKINYVFIFEFDTRHVLDWRQLAELPCLFAFLEGLFIWLNFRQPGADLMFIWWPVVLAGLTAIIMFFPAPLFYSHSRQWWAYANWRLLLAGLYPVEFRDFLLGDMYCSETYAMGNIELFFCLYAGHWGNPASCNSSHSRLLGFFSTVPAIWRALQCLRRYYDSRNWFPHLANCAKYFCNILFYMSLSLWRLNKVSELKALFILFGTINAIYCSIWDLVMDWSLFNPYARYPLLRETLGYRRVWMYYAAMILDPILRFNWIFYAIYANDIQHSSLISFFVGFSEVIRRGIWCIFRVENEHCTNVGRFRASRDIPLPYAMPSSSSPQSLGSDLQQQEQDGAPRPQTTGADLESRGPVSSPSLRKRNPRTPVLGGATPGTLSLHRVGTIITQAHAQDFEKKKRPDVVGDDSPESRGLMGLGYNSSDDDDEDEADDRGLQSSRDGERNGTDESAEDIIEARSMLDGANSGSDRSSPYT